jgi:Tfp pilus assembly protein PilF
VKDYSSAIELDGKHFKAFYNRAFCYEKMGDLEKAERDY